MAIELAEFTESLKRAVTPVGGTVYDGVSETAWVGYLSDSFWEARLDGFMVGYQANTDGVITPIDPTRESISRSWISLIILYASVRVLTNQILSTQTSFKAKAGPVEYEAQNSATVLAEMLKQLAAAKLRLLDDLRETGHTNVHLIDAFSVRSLSAMSYYGSIELTGS